MITLFFILAFAAQFMLVTGQVLLKRAVMAPHPARFALAIASMTVYFFTWLGVARYLPLSQLAPFDACGPVLLVLWARLTLHERLSPRAYLAVLTILTGVTLISLS